MLKFLASRVFWGIVLILGGILILLDTLGVFKGGALFWTIVSGFLGILFLSVFATNRVNWWALIPGVIFLAISLTIGLDSFLPGFTDTHLDGTIILVGIGLSFLLVYLFERANWWAIIPAGVMVTIASVAIIDSGTSGMQSGGVLFLGLGITFALVAFLPNPIGQMRWAWIPAGILGLMGVLLLITAEDLINYIWPSIIILVGIFLVWRSIKARR